MAAVTDAKKGETEEIKAREIASSYGQAVSPDYGRQQSLEGYAPLRPSLLGASGMGDGCNAAVRTDTMRGMQQTHGNRAVQRFVQREASSEGLTVQRMFANSMYNNFGMSVSGGEYQPPTGLMDPFGPFNPTPGFGPSFGEYQPPTGLMGPFGPFYNPTPSFPSMLTGGFGMFGGGGGMGPFYNPTPSFPSMPQMPTGGPFYNPTPSIDMPGINAPGPLPVGGPMTGGAGFEEYLKSIWGKEPAKPGEKPRGHSFWKEDVDKGNVEGGFSLFSGAGDIGGVPLSVDWLFGGGKSGQWDSDNGGTRVGTQLGVGINKWNIGKGTPVSFDAGVGTAQGEASWGDDGFSAGATANLVEGALTLGNFNNNKKNESQMKFGLSAGVGLGARGHWGDSDKDGKKEYGFGFDYGPVGFDYKTEDPLRSGLGMVLGGIGGPGGMYAADKALEWLGGDTNYTDEAVALGKSAYKYGSDAYDTVSKYGNKAYNTAADYGGKAYDATSKALSDGYGTMSNAASGAYNYISSLEMPSMPSLPDVSWNDLKFW